MESKAIAKMLFKMHLKKKPTSSIGKELWRYNDYNFTKLISFAENTDMEDTHRIAWAYPNYEFVVRFTNGDVVIFNTEGRDLHARKVLTGLEAARLMAEIEDDIDAWMEMDEIYIPEAMEIYGAPL